VPAGTIHKVPGASGAAGVVAGRSVRDFKPVDGWAIEIKAEATAKRKIAATFLRDILTAFYRLPKP
jgi:hypothetical protein